MSACRAARRLVDAWALTAGVPLPPPPFSYRAEQK